MGAPREKFTLWPSGEDEPRPTTDIMRMYDAGYAGATRDPEQRAAMLAEMAYPNGELAAAQFGFAASGVGKLTLCYKPAYDHWPKMWPCPGQTTGDCVSHAGKNAALCLIGLEVAIGLPDPVTGKIEGWPKVTAEAEQQGVVACENIYGARGHGGQGANCNKLQRYVMQEGGIMLRQPYPELGLDFTRYDASVGIRWGSRGVPEAVSREGAKHRLRNASDCPTHEVCRDFLAAGYPIWVCSGYGFSSERDENGYSVRRGSWAHSWIIMGYDDRASTKQKYGFPLALYNHDWGRWNRGGRRILGTSIDIPEGSMWIDARLLDRCDCTAMSNMDGWDPHPLPDWGAAAALN